MTTPLGSRYELIETIASGATGTVWRARVRGTGELVAAKEIRAELATDADVVDRFLRERRVLSSIQHPGVVRLRDLVVEGERIGLIMDLVEGVDLRSSLAESGPLDPGSAIEIAAAVADALAAAHAAGVVHADVKPANVLVPADGSPVRLADFGVARLVRGPAPTSYGTPEYIAPEVVLGHASIPASDVYGLGILLYELLTGSTPYRGGTSAEVMQRHVMARPIWTPGVPEAMRPLLVSCLHRDPVRRPSAETLAEDLRELASQLTAYGAAIPLPLGTPHFRLSPVAEVSDAPVEPDESVTSILPAAPGARSTVVALSVAELDWPTRPSKSTRSSGDPRAETTELDPGAPSFAADTESTESGSGSSWPDAETAEVSAWGVDPSGAAKRGAEGSEVEEAEAATEPQRRQLSPTLVLTAGFHSGPLVLVLATKTLKPPTFDAPFSPLSAPAAADAGVSAGADAQTPDASSDVDALPASAQLGGSETPESPVRADAPKAPGDADVLGTSEGAGRGPDGSPKVAPELSVAGAGGQPAQPASAARLPQPPSFVPPSLPPPTFAPQPQPSQPQPSQPRGSQPQPQPQQAGGARPAWAAQGGWPASPPMNRQPWPGQHAQLRQGYWPGQPPPPGPPGRLAPRPLHWPLVVGLIAACFVVLLFVGLGVLWVGVLSPAHRSVAVPESARPTASAPAAPKQQEPDTGQPGLPMPDVSDSPKSESPQAPDESMPPFVSPRPGDPSIGDPIG